MPAVQCILCEILMASTERFGYEWQKFDSVIPEYETQFLKWVAPLGPDNFRDKEVLDAGCGMGRNSYWPLKYGARRVVGVDFDERTVAAARRTLVEFPNAEVRFQSIYEIPDESAFDIVFSIGVIHHLERPQDALARMKRALKPGGTLLVWVYGHEGNEWVVRLINPLRHVLARLPIFITNFVSYVLAPLMYLFVKIVPQKQPYYKQLSTFRFWHIRSIILDQLLPKIAHYWRKDEAEALLREQGLTNIRIFPVNGLSWTVIGTNE